METIKFVALLFSALFFIDACYHSGKANLTKSDNYGRATNSIAFASFWAIVYLIVVGY